LDDLHIIAIWSGAFSRDGKTFLAGYQTGEVVAFSPQGDFVATGAMFDIALHDAKTGKKSRTLSHASYTMGLEFSPDGKRIASAPRGNVNKFLAVFDIDKDRPLFNAGPFDKHFSGLAFTPDGKRVIATGPQMAGRMFDASTGELAGFLTARRRGLSSRLPFPSHMSNAVWHSPV
jgi:WD40 repeat protein